MKRPGFGSILSLFLNILLSAWLFQQYLSDQYFHDYVNSAASPVFPYLVLTTGIGGGSSLGYILLRRKHSQGGLYGKLQKSRPVKQSGPLPGTTGTSLQSKNVPVGAPPGPTSKHTAYAVPSLSKSSTPSLQKSSPSTSWSMAAKQSTPTLTLGQQEQRTTPSPPPAQFSTTIRPETFSRQEPSSQPFSPMRPELIPKDNQLPQSADQRPSQFAPAPSLGEGLSRIPPTSGTESSGKIVQSGQWGMDSSKPGLGMDKSNVQFQKPFPGQSNQLTPSFQQQRPQPSESASKPGQWTDPVPRQSYTPPQKWAPPSVSPLPSSRPPGPVGPLIRPGQPPPGRPQFPGQQGPPRPLAFPGSMRAPPSGMPGQFRPDQPRPPGLEGLQRQPIQGQRPSPSQWTPQTAEKKDTLSQSTPSSSPAASQTDLKPRPVESPAQVAVSGESSGGEMDWDTALDTILKTLRKDKVGDKP